MWPDTYVNVASKTTTTTRLNQVFVVVFFLVTKWSSPVVDMMHGDHGAAWRRRQRRQRSLWRHEQLSVAMALKHSTPAYGHRRRTGPGRQKSKAAGDAVFFDLFEEEHGGKRPAPLTKSSTNSISECVFFQQKINNLFGRSPFFRRKVAIFIGRETKTHILLTNINDFFSLMSAPLTIIILLE